MTKPKLTHHATETSNINETILKHSSGMSLSLPNSSGCVSHNLGSVGGSTETTAEFQSLLLEQPYPLMEVMNTTGNFQYEPYRQESVDNPQNDFWVSFSSIHAAINKM